MTMYKAGDRLAYISVDGLVRGKAADFGSYAQYQSPYEVCLDADRPHRGVISLPFAITYPIIALWFK